MITLNFNVTLPEKLRIFNLGKLFYYDNDRTFLLYRSSLISSNFQVNDVSNRRSNSSMTINWNITQVNLSQVMNPNITLMKDICQMDMREDNNKVFVILNNTELLTLTFKSNLELTGQKLHKGVLNNTLRVILCNSTYYILKGDANHQFCTLEDSAAPGTNATCPDLHLKYRYNDFMINRKSIFLFSKDHSRLVSSFSFNPEASGISQSTSILNKVEFVYSGFSNFIIKSSTFETNRSTAIKSLYYYFTTNSQKELIRKLDIALEYEPLPFGSNSTLLDLQFVQTHDWIYYFNPNELGEDQLYVFPKLSKMGLLSSMTKKAGVSILGISAGYYSSFSQSDFVSQELNTTTNKYTILSRIFVTFLQGVIKCNPLSLKNRKMLKFNPGVNYSLVNTSLTTRSFEYGLELRFGNKPWKSLWVGKDQKDTYENSMEKWGLFFLAILLLMIVFCCIFARLLLKTKGFTLDDDDDDDVMGKQVEMGESSDGSIDNE